MSNRFTRKVIIVVASLMTTGAMLIGGAGPAAAATYPNQNWGQMPGNAAGVRFSPNGDWFEIWDNVNDGNPVEVYFNYKDVEDDWKRVGQVTDSYTKIQRNVYEDIDGKPAYIYFQVCDYYVCSNPSWYRTWGS
jgi:hypothetical protein